MAAHTFIFHNEEDLPTRAKFYPGDEIVAPHNPGDTIQYSTDMKYNVSAATLQTIRTRSPCIDHSISSAPLSPQTHIWPDPSRGVVSSKLRYVIELCLPDTAPAVAGEDRLQALGGICCVVWALKCDMEPFYNIAKYILEEWEQSFPEGEREAQEIQKAEQLTIIAFVLGPAFCKLETHLTNLVWNSSAIPNCPMEDLRKFVKKEREETLGWIYTLFQAQNNNLQRLYPNSGPVVRVDSRLTDQPGQSYIDLSQGWFDFRDGDGGRKVLKMSPQELYSGMLKIFQDELKDDSARNGAHRRTTSVSNQAISSVSGLRSGEGRDLIKLFKILFHSPPQEDKGAKALMDAVANAGTEKEKWKDRINDKIESLMGLRDDEQKKWKPGIPGQNQINGHAPERSSSQPT